MSINSPMRLMIIVSSTFFLVGNGVTAKEFAGKSATPGKAKVVSGDFGIYDPDHHQVRATRSVKFKSGDHYGWRFNVQSNQPTVSWKEEFRLPVAPKTWGDLEAGQKISADGKTCITEKTDRPQAGWIEHSWPELEGDPLGKYLMNVYIDGKLARTFKFTVQ